MKFKDRELKEIFQIEEILNNQFFFQRSRKLHVFKVKGTSCCRCSAIGTHFVMIVRNGGIELQLITVDTNGRLSFLTVDHIVPVSKGGSKCAMSNMQPMCNFCNSEKGNKEESVSIEQKEKK